MPEGVIYMDHAATTPTDPGVVEAMMPWFTERFGNPSGVYSLSRQAEEAVEASRNTCAELIGAEPEEIYFTSGGTESDNWALSGAVWAGKKKDRNKIVISAVEHHAVLEPGEFLQRAGFELEVIDVDKFGQVDPEAVREAVDDKTAVVSIMHANNEVGTIEPIEAIGPIVREAGALFHVDAVQTVGKIPVNLAELPVDLLSASAHKFYGPKGVGFLYIRRGTRLTPYLHGGAQERRSTNPGYTVPGRAGTHNVPGIVGLAEACRLASERMASEAERLYAMANRIRDEVMEKIPDVIYDGHPDRRVPGNAHFCFEGLEGEALLLCLDMNRLCVSSGSACTTGSLDPSHVLTAMGLPAETAHGSLRITLGHDNTDEDVDILLKTLPTVVARLRTMSPTYKK